MRPTPPEAEAIACAEPFAENAKVEGLRFELEVGVWRGDSALIARRVVADAACVSEPDVACDDDDE